MQLGQWVGLVISGVTIMGCSSVLSNPSVNSPLGADVAVVKEQALAEARKGAEPLVKAESFAQWKEGFYARAVALGFAPPLVEALLAQANYREKVVALDRGQPEFSKMVWEYLDSAVSEARIRKGRQLLGEYADFLRGLEARSGVPAEVVLAIWGLESGFGGAMGKVNLPSALATLAYDGRRAQFAEEQLLALLTLAGQEDWHDLAVEGSWAGGMGHTQFIPATFVRYGVDGNGDGRRDPWNVLDALASTASYLQQSGWVAGLPWGMEVRLPSGFDFALVEARLPLARWRALGVRAVEHEDLDGAVMARLWLPAGHQGAVFLVLDNYEVIKVYNQSSSYALAVGLLADRIGGGGGIVAKWPRQALGLSRAQVELLQSRLTALGYEVGGVDGVLGRRTREAFRQWQLDNGVLADGFVSQDSVAVLLGR